MTTGVLQYREQKFVADVAALRAAGGNRVSLVSLLDQKTKGGGPIADHARVYQSFQHQVWFLWCFFFDALLDQAIHTVERSTHTSIGRPQALKLGGILASYSMNLHPALLLLTASLLCDQALEAGVVADFSELTDSEMHRYSLALSDSVGQPGPESSRVYSEMSNGMALLFLPRGFGSFSRSTPNLEIYDLWTKAVAAAVNERCG